MALVTPPSPLVAATSRGEDRLIQLTEVCRRTGFSRAQIRRWAKLGKFPKPAKIGAAIRWSSNEVNAWIAEQVAARRVAR